MTTKNYTSLAATAGHYLENVKQLLAERGMDPDECARLRAVPFTLSQQGATKGLVKDKFMDAPELEKWGKRVLLVKRVRQTASKSRLRRRGGRSRNDQTDKGGAWRDTLLPSG
jgi:hypothetical protein